MKIKIWKDLIRSSRFHQILKNDLDKQTIPPFSLRTGNSQRKLSSIPRLQSAHWENLSTQKLLEISNCFRKIFQPLQRCVNQTEQKSPDKKHSCKSVLEQQKERYSHYSCYWWALKLFFFNFIMEVSHIWHFNQNHQKSKHEGKKLQFLHFPVFRSNVGKDFCCFEIWNVVFRFRVCQIANANQIKPNSPATKLNSRRRSHQGILNKMAKIFVKYHFALFPKKHFRKF